MFRASDKAVLIEDHLELVHRAARVVARRSNARVHDDDLIGAGYLGLCQAAERYDLDSDVPFGVIAYKRVVGAMYDVLRSGSAVSRGDNDLVAAYDKAVATGASNGTTPTLDDVAAMLHVDPTRLARAVAARDTSPLTAEAFAAPDDNGAECLADLLADRERTSLIRDAIAALPDRLRLVVVGRFFEDRPMNEMAEALGVNPSRAGQLLGDALALLREAIETHDAGLPITAAGVRPATARAAFLSDLALLPGHRARLARADQPVHQRVAERRRAA